MSTAVDLTTFLENRALFIPWIDPGSGITSHILTPHSEHRIAPHQQSFYYLNPSFTADTLKYWFYCAFPPTPARSLGVVDFQRQTLRHFPETCFTSAPMIDPSTDDVYWATLSGIWKLASPTANFVAATTPQLVNRFPASIVRNRTVHRYATHLTMTADRKALFIDSQIGSDCVLGLAPLDGSEIEILQSVPLSPHPHPTLNHGQANPIDSGLFLVAHDYYTNPQTGVVRPYDNRLWLIRRGGQVAPVYPTAAQAGPDRAISSINPHLSDPEASRRTITDPRAMHGHEWWSADGRHIYYIHYQTGIERTPIATACTPDARPELIWPHDTVSHAHASADGKLFVLDALPPDAPDTHHVRFVNLHTRRTVDIVSKFPALSDPELRRYHVHPHPQFCGADQFICYTTTIFGRMDVAFVRVSELLTATS
ncbi:hypothetical protein Ga0100231_001590 [Opitutaceae bacterium TAV4]|nr:hypothetical protein Ga0100230_007730 [Opitutaceae bacterium TAV3]RRK01511.1 hypothetical protein Ga0100231_001590 [Opitutaceae bacterium TAV4]